MSVEVAKTTFTLHSFTVEEYGRMGEAGVFSPDVRVELIEGEIVEMSPIGNRHAACVDVMAEMLREALGRSVIIRVQNPIVLDDYSEPQPDIAVLKRRDDFYRHAAVTGYFQPEQDQNGHIVYSNHRDTRGFTKTSDTVLRAMRAQSYTVDRHDARAGPDDVLLVIEVSDSTLEYDRQIKVPLYARAGISEVWIVNINDERVETFADVSGGAYQMTGSVSRGEEVQSRSLAALRISVSEIFG